MNSTQRQSKRQKRLFTIEESATYLGRTPWAMRHLVWMGVIPCVRIGGGMQIDIQDLDHLIDSSKELDR